MDIQKLMQMNSMKNKFTKNHPMVPKFIKKIRKDGLEIDDVIEIKVIKKNGEECTANIKIMGTDLELLNQLMEMGSGNA